MPKTIMIIGLGAVGEVALQILSRSEGIDRIVTSGRNEALGAFKTRVAALCAAYQTHDKRFDFYPNDLRDVDTTTRLLEDIRPDAVLLVASLKSPNILSAIRLPSESRSRLLAAGFGCQLPWHLLLPYRFMQALEKSGIDTRVINGSFPDVTGSALWKHFGHGPDLGMGNIDLTAVQIIRHVSQTEGVGIADIKLSLVSSHAYLVHGIRKDVPCLARIGVGNRDLTDRYDIREILRGVALGKASPADRQSAQSYFNFVTASSAVKNIMAIIMDKDEYTHVPAPNGLVGGYPVRLNAKGAQLCLPEDWDLEQAIEINEAAERFDGVEEIRDDGTIVYTDETYTIMKDIGYDCKELALDELESRGRQLDALIEGLQDKGI